MTPEHSPSDEKANGRQWSAVRFAWELGYLIAIPVIILAVGGALLDRWLGTKPWLLIAGVILSIIITTIGVAIKAMRIMGERAGESTSQSQSDTQKNSKPH